MQSKCLCLSVCRIVCSAVVDAVNIAVALLFGVCFVPSVFLPNLPSRAPHHRAIRVWLMRAWLVRWKPGRALSRLFKVRGLCDYSMHKSMTTPACPPPARLRLLFVLPLSLSICLFTTRFNTCMRYERTYPGRQTGHSAAQAGRARPCEQSPACLGRPGAEMVASPPCRCCDSAANSVSVREVATTPPHLPSPPLTPALAPLCSVRTHSALLTRELST